MQAWHSSLGINLDKAKQILQICWKLAGEQLIQNAVSTDMFKLQEDSTERFNKLEIRKPQLGLLDLEV